MLVHVQPKLALKRALVFLFLLERVRVVFRLDQRVGRRVVLGRVDAVQDAAQHVPARAQQPVQPLAVIGRKDFLRVSGGDGGNAVGKHQSALDERALAVEFQIIRRVRPVAQRKQLLRARNRVQSLELQIVNGEHGLDVLIQRQRRVLRLQKHGNQAGLPVVAVQNVGHKVDLGNRFQHGLAEIGKPLALVLAASIDIVAAEVLLVVHEIINHAVALQLFNAHILAAPAKVDIEIQNVLQLLAHARVDGAVQRQNHAHVRALARQRLGQRAHHVRQTAGFYKRHAFGSGKQNLHAVPSFGVGIFFTASRSCPRRWDTASRRSGACR